MKIIGPNLLIGTFNFLVSLCIGIFALFSPLSTYPFYIYDTKDKYFQFGSTVIISTLCLTFFPCLFSLVFGKLVNKHYFDKSPPRGAWVFVGNPFPETGVIFSEYPERSNEKMTVCYIQSPSIGGMIMYPLHVYLLNNVHESIITSQTYNVKYFLPTVRKTDVRVPDWLKNLKFVPTTDYRVWGRSYENSSYIPYYWVHISHSQYFSHEYHMLLPHYGTKAYITCVFSIVFVFSILVWSWGLAVISIIGEMIIRSKFHVMID